MDYDPASRQSQGCGFFYIIPTGRELGGESFYIFEYQ